MGSGGAALVDIAFTGVVIEWRGPAPFFFIAIPADHVGEVACAARLASYGWGVVPVTATIGGLDFRTSLFPRGDTYLLPLKLAVRRAAGVALGEAVEVALRIHAARA